LIKRHIPDRGKILNHGKPILMNPINNRNKEYNTTAIKQWTIKCMDNDFDIFTLRKQKIKAMTLLIVTI
jgi:hypothetical protein